MVANVLICQACRAESPADAKFCSNCGERFALRCPSCGATVTATARFCGECGTALKAATPAPLPAQGPAQSAPRAVPAAHPADADSERRHLTVLFCDIVNSTGLSHQLDPEELRAILRTYQEACAAAVTKVEGHLAKYMGDGIMAYFGYPQAHGDDARRAVLAAIDIVAAVRAISRELRARTNRKIKVRVGIHTGLVVTGELGGGAVREQYGVVGEAPNVAARLQSMAEANAIVISAQTKGLLPEEFAFRPLGLCQIKGLPQPLQLFEVDTSGDRAQPPPRRRPVELAGRRKERELLLDRWEMARSGSGQTVLVSGEAGIGKSALTASLRESLEAQSNAVLTLQCSPFFQSTPFYPVGELMTRALALTPGDEPARHIEKIRASLATIGVAGEAIVGQMAQFLNVASDDPRHAPDPDPARRRRTTLETLVAWLFAGTGQNAKLILVEDAHWADSSTVELLGLLLEQIATAKVLAVVTFRPEFQPPWPMRSYLTALALPKLSTEDVAVLANRAAGATLPPPVIERIHLKTDGVPLFVEELTKTIVASGKLKRSNGAFLLEGSLESVPIPATLRDSLMARLDRLGKAKLLAQLGAAIGREFDYVLLSSLWSGGAQELDEQLRALVGAEILYQRGLPPAALYLFKHALIQEIAYESRLLSARQELHGRIADAYLSKFADAGRNQPELVARHLTAAGRPAEAAEYWLLAGERAFDRWANADAIDHFGKALAAVERLPEGPDKDEREVAIRLRMGSCLVATEGMASDRMHEMYARAAELARRRRMQNELCTALWNEWLYNSQTGRQKEALAFAEEVVQLSERTNDQNLVLQARHARWTTNNLLGKFDKVRDDTEQGVALYDVDQHYGLTFAFGGHDAGVCARGTGALALWLTGRPAAALELATDAVRLSGEIAHPFSRGIALWFAMMVEQGCSAYDRLVAHGETAAELASQYKLAQLRWMARASLGRGLIDLGQADKGFPMLRGAVADMEAAKFNSAYGLYYRFILAEALAGQRDFAEALAITDRTLGLLDASGQAFFRPDYLRLRGDCLLGLNGVEQSGREAEQLYRQAMRLADFQGSLVHRLRSALSCARLLLQLDRAEEGRKLVSDSLAVLPEKGILPELSEALTFTA